MQRVTELYDRGLYLQACTASQPLGPLREWRGTAARLIGGRLAMNIGAPRLGRALHMRAWREDRAYPETVYWYARALYDYQGPLSAWAFLKRQSELPEAPTGVRADWLAFHSTVLAGLRDFDAAEEWLAKAERLAPERAWVHVERAHLLELEDNVTGALEAAQRALALRPLYRPAAQYAAHVLEMLGREQEALELLRAAAARLECSSLYGQLSRLETELGLHDAALASARRYLEMVTLAGGILQSPAEEAVQEGAHCLLSDAEYLCGHYAQAAEHARRTGKHFFFQKIAERLTAVAVEPGGMAAQKRVLLPVGFVRQHHMTCAPATLAALSRFWSKPADHLELAEAICYEGTPAHSERNWAERNGWVVREFTVNWDDSVALIERGIPFTLTTREATSSHLQAVIGYDTFRGTLLSRDPGQRSATEFIATARFERHRANGPRGMVMAPVEKAALLEGLALQDAAAYDLVHAIHTALEAHDRRRAQEVYGTLAARWPEHYLTLQARRGLALYDGDQTAVLNATEGLLKINPRDASLTLSRLASLRHFARRDERLALLDEICEFRPATVDDKGRGLNHPVFWRFYAEELRADARQHHKAVSLLRGAVRCLPGDPFNYALLADIEWDRGRFDAATELYRFAACMNDKDEHLARSYFTALRHFKQQEIALRLMEGRVKRSGRKSSQPAQTLSWALSQLDRDIQAFEVLEEALKLRPEDGELMLYAAEAFGANGRLERGAELLAHAEGKSPRGAWLRTAALAARYNADLPRARDLWRQVLETEPLAMDAHRALVRLLAETEGQQAARQHLGEACARFPYNFLLHQFHAEWLRDVEWEAAEPILRHMVEIDNADAWTHRELALLLSRRGRHDEALAEAELGRQLEPLAPQTHCVLGDAHLHRGDVERARAGYHEAVRLSVDCRPGINAWLDACNTSEEKREALAFVHNEMVRQVIFGEGLLTYRDRAQRLLKPEELLAALREAHAARPDLWHCWSVLVQQLSEMNRLDEAGELAARATERFPLAPRLWLDRAEVCRLKQDQAGRKEALAKALQITPGWGYAARTLAEAHEADGDLKAARAVLEGAVARAPLDGYNHGCLADIQWRLGEREAAVERLQRTLRLQPDYGWAWRSLRVWGEQLRRPNLAEEMARDLVQRRGGEAATWVTLASVLTGKEHTDERLRALERAIELDPRDTEAHDHRARLLAQEGRFEEAAAACDHPVWRGRVPVTLRGRRAWIEAERGHLDQAIGRLTQTLETDPDYQWGWSCLAEWYETKKDYAASARAAGNLIRIAPTDNVAYGYRARAKELGGDLDGARLDYQHALELQPDYVWAARALFDLELEAGRLDDAERAVARALAFAPTDPLSIARRAQLDGRRGSREAVRQRLRELLELETFSDAPFDVTFGVLKDLGAQDDAVEALRDTVKARPDYYLGWKLLADLVSEEKGAQREYLRCATEMVRLRPNDEIAYGYLGYAKRLVADYKGARAAFAQAFSMEPRYAYAGRWLFDMQMDSGRLDDAAGTLTVLRQHNPDSETWLRAMKLAQRRRNKEEALAALAEICARENADPAPLWSGLKMAWERDWEFDALRVLHKAMHEFKAAAAKVWVERTAQLDRWPEIEAALDHLDLQRESGMEALKAYLNALAEAGAYARFAEFVAGRKDLLRGRNELWAAVGDCYFDLQRWSELAAWLSDWRERQGLRPWMLLNAGLGNRILKHGAEAEAVHRHALSLPRGPASDYHALWLAWDAALAGNCAEAEAAVKQTGGVSGGGYYGALRALVQALLETPQFPGAAGAEAFRLARQRVAEAAKQLAGRWTHASIPLVVLGTVRHLAARRGGLSARLWSWSWRVRHFHYRFVLPAWRRLAKL